MGKLEVLLSSIICVVITFELMFMIMWVLVPDYRRKQLDDQVEEILNDLEG